jgi:hypothetical protein
LPVASEEADKPRCRDPHWQLTTNNWQLRLFPATFPIAEFATPAAYSRLVRCGMCRGAYLTLFLWSSIMKLGTTLLLAATLFTGLTLTGCETHHSESDKDTMFGGHKHTETTTTKNPVTGDTNVSHTETKTNP